MGEDALQDEVALFGGSSGEERPYMSYGLLISLGKVFKLLSVR